MIVLNKSFAHNAYTYVHISKLNSFFKRQNIIF